MLGEYRRHVLPNGLCVLGVENRALHSFVCSAYVRMGPRYEGPDEVGLSHFLEHMLTQGSARYPSSQAIMRAVEDLGGVLDAGTYPDYVNFAFGAHRKHWAKLMDIAADVLAHPLLPEDEIRQERGIVAQEIAHDRDASGRNISAAELAYGLIFRGRADEAGTRGSVELLETFDRPKLMAHYERFFLPSNLVLCLAGAFDFDEALEKVEEGFGGMAGEGSPPRPIPPAARQPGMRALYRMTESLPVVEVLLCHPAFALGDDRFYGAQAVAEMLGGGLSSRLFLHVREELGLVYEVFSQVRGYSDVGTLEVFLSVSAENLVPTVEATLGTLRAAAAEGFRHDELARCKEAARCGMEMLCDRPAHLADWYGKQELLVGPGRIITPQEFIRRYDALTLEGVSALARQMLDLEGADLVVVGPYSPEHKERVSALVGAREVEAEPAARASDSAPVRL